MAINSPDRIGTMPHGGSLAVHVEDFSPAALDSLRFGLGFLRRSAYGPHGALFHEAVARGKGRVAKFYEPIVNGAAIENIMDSWGITDPYSAGKFYQDQIKIANKTISHVLDVTVPGWKQNYSLMQELTSPSERPSWGLLWSAKGVQKQSKRMTYEAQRQSLLAASVASLNVRTEEDRLGTVRSDFQNAMLDIYTNPDTKPYVLETRHDEETGKVVSVGGYEVGSARNTNLRRREYQTRYIEGVGPVIVGDRQKGDPEMILKMLVKAKNRLLKGEDGYLRPQDATDAFGMKLVVLEPGENGYDSAMQKLQDVVVKKLSASETLPVRYLEPDNGKSVNRGSSQYHDFLRLQVHLQDVSVPFEVIIQDAPSMRNDEVMHGVPSAEVWKDYQYEAFKQETGISLKEILPDGAEHGLYRFKRYLAALPTLFPASIYGDRLIEHALDNLQQRERWLRDVDRVEDFDLSKFDVW